MTEETTNQPGAAPQADGAASLAATRQLMAAMRTEVGRVVVGQDAAIAQVMVAV